MMKKTTTLALLSLAALACSALAAPVTEAVTIRTSDGAVLNTVAANFTAGKLKVGGVSITATPAWSAITGKPTTISGYGITDPVVLTSGSYSNPSWISAFAWSKLTGTPTTLEGYGLAHPGDENGGAGGAVGTFNLNGGNSDGSGNGGSAGSVLTYGAAASAGSPGGNGGDLLTFGAGLYSGGSFIAYSNGSNNAGTVNTQAGGSLFTGAGNINMGDASGTIASAAFYDVSSFQPYSGELSALADLSATGLVVRTGPSAPAVRTLTGTSGQITVTNGNGVSGNPTFALATTGVTATTYDRITVDAYGRATGGDVFPWLFAEGSGAGTLHMTGIVVDFWSKTAGTGTITAGKSWSPGKAGWYYMHAWLGGSVTTDQVQIAFVVNGTVPNYAESSQFYRGVSGFNAVYLNATDTVTVSGIAYSGDWYTTGYPESARWIVRWLGPP